MDESPELKELLKNINDVIISGVNKIVYDIQYKKLNNELNKCKAELEKLKKTYKVPLREPKKNIELQINENIVVDAEIKQEKEVPKYEKILQDVSEEDNNGLLCENCDDKINPIKEGYHILYKKNAPELEQILCGQCYDDLFDEFKKEGWICDDDVSNDTINKEPVTLTVEEESDADEVEEESVGEEIEEEESVADEVDDAVEEEEEDAVEDEVEEEEEEVEEEEEEESVADEVEEEEEEESVADEVEEEEEEESVADEVEEEESVAEEEEEESVADEVEEEESVAEEVEEEEVFEIEIDDVSYFATNEENGPIYEVDKDGDPGNKVGYLKDGEPIFY